MKKLLDALKKVVSETTTFADDFVESEEHTSEELQDYADYHKLSKSDIDEMMDDLEKVYKITDLKRPEPGGPEKGLFKYTLYKGDWPSGSAGHFDEEDWEKLGTIKSKFDYETSGLEKDVDKWIAKNYPGSSTTWQDVGLTYVKTADEEFDIFVMSEE